MIVMTLLVRDEEDIVAASLDYHLSQGVDHFIVTDHLSEDSTAEILKDYVDRRLVHDIHESSESYDQHAWVTRMARLAFTEHGADWVINSDADEFWWPAEGTLATTFAGLPSSVNVIKAQRFNFVPVEETGAKVYERMVYREKISFNQIHEPSKQRIRYEKVAPGIGAVDKDEELAEAVTSIEESAARTPEESRTAVREEIEKRYTAPV